MTTQPQPLPISAPHRLSGRHRIAALAGAGVILVLAVSIGLWQSGRPGTTASSVSPPTAATARPVLSRTDPTIYVAGTRAEAQAVYAALEEANAVLVTSGEPTRAHPVMWFDSLEEEAAFWSLMGERERTGLGPDPVTVVDLRAPAPSVPSLDPAAFSD